MRVGRPRCRPAELGWRTLVANALAVFSISRKKERIELIRVGGISKFGVPSASRNIHDGGLRYQYVCTAWLQ